jgi:hypothetical protein
MLKKKYILVALLLFMANIASATLTQFKNEIRTLNQLDPQTRAVMLSTMGVRNMEQVMEAQKQVCLEKIAGRYDNLDFKKFCQCISDELASDKEYYNDIQMIKFCGGGEYSEMIELLFR